LLTRWTSIINSRQSSDIHTYTLARKHTNWCLALGWVTIKEYHSRLCIDFVDFMVRYECNYITLQLHTFHTLGFIAMTTCVWQVKFRYYGAHMLINTLLYIHFRLHTAILDCRTLVTLFHRVNGEYRTYMAVHDMCNFRYKHFPFESVVYI